MSEASTVQNPMLRYADQIGWDYISRSEAMQRRNGDAKELYFTDILQSPTAETQSRRGESRQGRRHPPPP